MDRTFTAKSTIKITAFSLLAFTARLVGMSLMNEYNRAVIIRDSCITFGVCEILMISLFFILQKERKQNFNEDLSTNQKDTFRIFFAIILACYTVAFMTYFPGTSYCDTTFIIRNGMMMGNQFPPVFCLIMVLFTKLGTFLGSIRMGYIIYTILQVILVSYISAWICEWARKKDMPKLIKCILFLYVALNPLFAVYAVSVIKDTLFSIAVAAITALLYDLVVERKTSDKACWEGVAFLTALIIIFRNNGLYIMVPLLIILLFVLKDCRKEILLILGEIVFIQLVAKVLAWRFDFTALFKESVAIPLQQISAVVAKDGVITQSQMEFINNIMPLEKIKESYDSSYVDPIKWSIYFNDGFINDNKFEFIKVWFEILLNNFGIYVKAYLQQTLWFWIPMNHKDVLLVTWLGGVPQEWLTENGLIITPLLNGKILSILTKYYESAKLIPCEGICIWFMFAMCLLRNLTLKDKKTLIGFLPCILLWLTIMISAPTNAGTRYILPFMYGVPVFVTMTFAKTYKQ